MPEAESISAAPSDLIDILGWLHEEYQADGHGFWSNRRIIHAHFERHNLFVIRDGGMAVAFQAGRHSADILCVRKADRGKGYGARLVAEAVQRAEAENEVVLQGECAPETSYPFWQKMGFEAYRDPRKPDTLTVRRVLPKAFVLPEGEQRVVVQVSFYPEKALYARGGDTAPLAIHEVEAVAGKDGTFALGRRVIGLNDDEPNGLNLAIRIVADGNELIFGKCKHEAATAIGVQKTGSDFFIDRLFVPS